GLLGLARAPAGAPPVWLISTKTASFFSAAGARFFLTVTISLWVTTTLLVLAAAGKTVAFEASARTTTVATRKRNMHQGYGACLVAPSTSLSHQRDSLGGRGLWS